MKGRNDEVRFFKVGFLNNEDNCKQARTNFACFTQELKRRGPFNIEVYSELSHGMISLTCFLRDERVVERNP